MILLAMLLWKHDKRLFLVTEALTLISLGISYALYASFIKPLNILAVATESIKEKDFSIKFLPVGQYEIDQLVEVYNRMIDQLREERILTREKHYFLEQLVTASPSGIIILSLDQKVSNVNPTAARILGIAIEKIKGTLLSHHQGILKEISEMENQTSAIIQHGSKTIKVQKAHFIDQGTYRYFILLEELTSEILQAEKQAYGKVIRMMSHEINNSIAAINSILNSTKIYKDQLKPEDGQEFEEVIQVSIDRNTKLGKFMSNFADVVRLPPAKRELADLHQILQNIVKLFQQKAIDQKITLQLNADKFDFQVFVDRHQIDQVLINILKNAIESIGQEGSIEVQTIVSQKLLIIRDSGAGIDEESRSKLFTPFFSSKTEGQGIGLTIIREVLVGHGFRFELSTVKPKVTEFKIYF